MNNDYGEFQDLREHKETVQASFSVCSFRVLEFPIEAGNLIMVFIFIFINYNEELISQIDALTSCSEECIGNNLNFGVITNDDLPPSRVVTVIWAKLELQPWRSHEATLNVYLVEGLRWSTVRLGSVVFTDRSLNSSLIYLYLIFNNINIIFKYLFK